MGIKKHSAPLTHTLRQVECRVVDGVIMVLLLRKDTHCKAKIAASEDFALAEIIFALAESCPVRQIHPFTHFQPQFTHFQPRQPPTK